MATGSDHRTHPSLLGRLAVDPAGSAAWEEFVERYGRLVFRWCRAWKLQDADAEDVTQDILLRVARQMQTFRYDATRSFRGWLRTVARRAWCDWLDAQQRPGRGTGDSAARNQLALIEARDDLVKTLEEAYDGELLEMAIARVRLRVETVTWDAFRLQALEGLSGAEAADRLGIKVGSAFVAKSRVRKLLQETIRELEGDSANDAEPADA